MPPASKDINPLVDTQITHFNLYYLCSKETIHGEGIK
ncbi:hypothetical protein LCGC14_2881980, partial [marine sediment metagenome]